MNIDSLQLCTIHYFNCYPPPDEALDELFFFLRSFLFLALFFSSWSELSDEEELEDSTGGGGGGGVLGRLERLFLGSVLGGARSGEDESGMNRVSTFLLLVCFEFRGVTQFIWGSKNCAVTYIILSISHALIGGGGTPRNRTWRLRLRSWWFFLWRALIFLTPPLLRLHFLLTAAIARLLQGNMLINSFMSVSLSNTRLITDFSHTIIYKNVTNRNCTKRHGPWPMSTVSDLQLNWQHGYASLNIPDFWGFR